jgi:mRNA-degrading endonuclease RelE of RelBE toxin-antitoxin system
MQLSFIELPPFQRLRADYLSDEAYRALQLSLLENPEAGDVIEGTGGLRKIRHADAKRGKGKRGGLRVIYYYWIGSSQCWLFTVYNKDEAADLTPAQRKILKALLEQTLKERQTP